jgi:hypothetical protein
VRCSLANLGWLLVYFAVMVAVTAALFKARRDVSAVYGTDQAQAEWDQWREDAKTMTDGNGPVSRREPRSAQPPVLLLMRDHFVVCLGLALVLSSVLFATFMFFIRGALAPTSQFVDRSPKRTLH